MTNGHNTSERTFFGGTFFLMRNFHVILNSILNVCEAVPMSMCGCLFSYHTNDEKAILQRGKYFFICANWQSYELHSTSLYVQKKPTRKLFSRLSLNLHRRIMHWKSQWVREWQTCECARHTKTYVRKYTLVECEI